MADTTPVVLRVPEPLLDAVRAEAAELDITTNAYVGAVVLDYIGGTATPPPPEHHPVRSFAVPTEVAEAIAARATELGTTRSEVVRQALMLAVASKPAPTPQRAEHRPPT